MNKFRTFFFALLLVLSCMDICNAQGQRYLYCEMTSSKMPGQSNVIIQIDWGQDAIKQGVQSLCDEMGNVINFNSHIDALNFMSRKGWELVQMYLTGERQSNMITHWILRLDTRNLTDEQKSYMLSVFNFKRNFK